MIEASQSKNTESEKNRARSRSYDRDGGEKAVGEEKKLDALTEVPSNEVNMENRDKDTDQEASQVPQPMENADSIESAPAQVENDVIEESAITEVENNSPQMEVESNSMQTETAAMEGSSEEVAHEPAAKMDTEIDSEEGEEVIVDEKQMEPSKEISLEPGDQDAEVAEDEIMKSNDEPAVNEKPESSSAVVQEEEIEIVDTPAENENADDTSDVQEMENKTADTLATNEKADFEAVELICDNDTLAPEEAGEIETTAVAEENVQDDIKNSENIKEMTEEKEKQMRKERLKKKKQEVAMVKKMKMSELRDYIRGEGKKPVGKTKQPLVDLALKCARAKYKAKAKTASSNKV